MNNGQLVGGRFEAQSLAGRGGMGEVWQALDRATGKVVALKAMRQANAEYTVRFHQEVELMRTLAHESIVGYVASGSTPDGDPWFAMEWLEGYDLAAHLKKGVLSIEEAIVLGTQVASALGYAHEQGVVHRDIKPHNLFLVGGDVARVKVLDFGVAKLVWSSTVHTAHDCTSLLGSPRYRAPEQERGDSAIDARADVFSLGCVLFECVTGRRCFEGQGLEVVLAKVLFDEVPPASSVADIPDVLDDLIRRMVAKIPASRPPNGFVVVGELEGARDNLDTCVTSIRADPALSSRTEQAPSVLPTEEGLPPLVETVTYVRPD